jgi:hypothetical protein
MKNRSLILSTIALMWASVGSATPPYIESFIVIDDLFIADCGSFDVRTRAPTRITEKTFFNKSGEPVGFHASGHITESIYYNSTDDSIFVSQGANGVGENFFFMLDLITGEIVNAGGFFRLTLPGFGHVVMLMGVQKVDAEGNVVFNGLEAFPEGDTAAALCAALSP